MNSSKIWFSRRTMIFKLHLAVPKVILVSFLNHKRFRQTISPLKTRSQYNYNVSLPPWKNNIIVERQRSLLKCQAARIRSRQVRARTVPIIRYRHSRKIRIPNNRGRKIRTRYPQMNSIKLTLSARLRRLALVKIMGQKRRKHYRNRSCWTKVRCSQINLIVRSKRINRRALVLLNPKMQTRFSSKIVRKMTRNRKPKFRRSNKWCKTKTSRPTSYRNRQTNSSSRLQR